MTYAGEEEYEADEVRFADMAEVGANPARIIPPWQRFVDEHAGRPVRGIGEPVWAERSTAAGQGLWRANQLCELGRSSPPAASGAPRSPTRALESTGSRRGGSAR